MLGKCPLQILYNSREKIFLLIDRKLTVVNKQTKSVKRIKNGNIWCGNEWFVLKFEKKTVFSSNRVNISIL